MQKLNVNAFYNLGGFVKHHYSLIADGDVHFPEQIASLYQLKAWFEIFLDRSADTTWRATRDRARQLIQLLASPKLLEIPGAPQTQSMDFDYVRQIHKLISIFESTFASESEGSNVFSISPKGTHAILDLMDRADENLPLDVRGRLSPEAIQDIRDAGKCLALDCHTASGYHMLRGVERIIIKYVEKVTGTTYGTKNRNWGAYIRVLKTSNADSSVIGYLDHMRLFYRNPVIHPDQTLDGNEAFSLFNASLSAIIQLDAAIEAWP